MGGDDSSWRAASSSEMSIDLRSDCRWDNFESRAIDIRHRQGWGIVLEKTVREVVGICGSIVGYWRSTEFYPAFQC